MALEHAPTCCPQPAAQPARLSTNLSDVTPSHPVALRALAPFVDVGQFDEAWLLGKRRDWPVAVGQLPDAYKKADNRRALACKTKAIDIHCLEFGYPRDEAGACCTLILR